MSPFDLSAGPSSRVGFAPTNGSPDVRWIRPDTPACLPPPMSKMALRSERANAIVVIVLTLACTALAIFDLLLLASGA